MSETRHSGSAPATRHLIDRVYTSRDQHAEGLSCAYSDLVMNSPASDDPFRVNNSSLSFSDLRLARTSTVGRASFSASHNQSFHVGFVSVGGAQVEARKEEISTSPMRIAHLLRGQDRFSVDLAPSTTSHVVEVSTDNFLKNAREYLGVEIDPDALLREVNLVCPAGAALARNVVSAFFDLKTLQSVSHSELAAVSYAELLTGLMIASIVPGAENTGASSGGQAVTDLARDYIVAHSSEALRISEVASAVGLSVRMLQKHFRNRFGCSPLQFLVECRLENARLRLQGARHGDTVTSIAWECGFIQLGLFAARYRSRFGELPSETLKRGQAE